MPLLYEIPSMKPVFHLGFGQLAEAIEEDLSKRLKMFSKDYPGIATTVQAHLNGWGGIDVRLGVRSGTFNPTRHVMIYEYQGQPFYRVRYRDFATKIDLVLTHDFVGEVAVTNDIVNFIMHGVLPEETATATKTYLAWLSGERLDHIPVKLNATFKSGYRTDDQMPRVATEVGYNAGRAPMTPSADNAWVKHGRMGH